MTTTPDSMKAREITAAVRERYAQAALQAASGTAACCGGGDGCCTSADRVDETWGAVMYATDDLATLPDTAVLASLGCGNPTALADLRPGETVLDLGSGGGIDVLLSARRVGPTGFAYGLDMTDEMLALAQANKANAGIHNAAFLKGRIEDVPLPNGSVDVVISNCVVNLSPDKDATLREAYRVLKPGGRLAIADVVIRDADPGEGAIPEALRRDMERWAGCIAGALDASAYRTKLAAAGFADAAIVEVKRYRAADLGNGADARIPEAVAGRFISAFVRATKPGGLVPLPVAVTATSSCGCGAEAVAGECCDDKATCCGEASACC